MGLINMLLLKFYHQNILQVINKLSYVHPTTHPASMIVQDQFNKFVTSSQIEKWNNKLDADSNAVSASKLLNPIKINGVEFDGTKDIEISLNDIKYDHITLNYVLEQNQNSIIIPEYISISDETIIYIFVNGIKYNDKLYNINYYEKEIIINDNLEKKSDIEVVITNIPKINNINGILLKNTISFSFVTNLNISSASSIFVFVNGIKLINNKHYSIDFENKLINFKESYKDDSEIEIIINKV